ncbi:hypothetical protein GE09DRAFT_773333 [Coniochaeta sp. 2T2.1]|nr:hypothetical protein GE09DRAFT_773333 [Coniochaeta sp. 2T2.1]
MDELDARQCCTSTLKCRSLFPSYSSKSEFETQVISLPNVFVLPLWDFGRIQSPVAEIACQCCSAREGASGADNLTDGSPNGHGVSRRREKRIHPPRSALDGVLWLVMSQRKQNFYIPPSQLVRRWTTRGGLGDNQPTSRRSSGGLALSWNANKIDPIPPRGPDELFRLRCDTPSTIYSAPEHARAVPVRLSSAGTARWRQWGGPLPARYVVVVLGLLGSCLCFRILHPLPTHP